MDVHLPERHGIKTAKQLKDNSMTRCIPIIFISALAEKIDRLLGLQSGAVDKPYYVDEVLERVRIHIALSRRKSTVAPKMPHQDAALASIPKMLSVNTGINRVATEFIRMHISDSALKGSDVAARLGLSIHRLNIVFDAMAGMTVFEFIRQERMGMAAELLKTGSLGVADIAAEVGYANSGNFSTEFKKFWKQSPKHYRLAFQGTARLPEAPHSAQKTSE